MHDLLCKLQTRAPGARPSEMDVESIENLWFFSGLGGEKRVKTDEKRQRDGDRREEGENSR